MVIPMSEFTFTKPTSGAEFVQYSVHPLANGVLAACMQWSPDILEWREGAHAKHSESLEGRLQEIAEESANNGPIKSWDNLSKVSFRAASAILQGRTQWREKLFMHGYSLAVIAEAETREDPTVHPYVDYETSGNVGIAVRHGGKQHTKFVPQYVGDPKAYLSECQGFNFPVSLPATVYLGPSTLIQGIKAGETIPEDVVNQLGHLVFTSN